jgi:hypothetical protein
MTDAQQVYLSLLKEMEEIKRRSEMAIEMLKDEIEKGQHPSSKKVSMIDLMDLPPIMRSIVLKISSVESMELSKLIDAFSEQEEDLSSLLKSLVDKGYIEEFEENKVKKFRVQEIRKKPKKLTVDIWKSLDEKMTSK